MQEKWQIKKKKKKKDYLKIHIAVDVKTKKILAFLEVTDEKVHDGKIMPKLIDYILKNDNNIKIKSVIGDRAPMIVMEILNIFKIGPAITEIQ